MLRFFTWFIIFNGFVPISLLVSMEIVKFVQGIFIGWDVNMAWLAGTFLSLFSLSARFSYSADVCCAVMAICVHV